MAAAQNPQNYEANLGFRHVQYAFNVQQLKKRLISFHRILYIKLQDSTLKRPRTTPVKEHFDGYRCLYWAGGHSVHGKHIPALQVTFSPQCERKRNFKGGVQTPGI